MKYCGICGSSKKVEIHHIDCNHNNNATENRCLLCQRCHALVHNHLGIVEPGDLRKLRKKVLERDPSRFPKVLFDFIEKE